MPKLAKELTAVEVKRLTHPGTHRGVARFPVGGVPGLMLSISETGGRSWVFRVMVGTKRRVLGLGGYPATPLAAARDRAREVLDLIREGIDPLEDRKAKRAALATAQARGMTFDEAVERFLSAKLDEIGNARHAQAWANSLRDYASPELGKMLVDDITVQDILRALEPHWRVRTETASRLRGRIEAVLAWATVAGHRTGDNPARWRGNLDALLPKPSKIKQGGHQPALALTDAVQWFAALHQRDGMAARALELIALTAARSGEVRGATWPEIDLDGALWVVPGERMKSGKEHRVPLVPEAVQLLRDLPRVSGSDFVFPNIKGSMLSDMSVSAVMRRMQAAEEAAERKGWLDPQSGRPAVPHGLRSTFRDWAAEHGIERDVAELALAHNVGSEVERAYRRTDLFEHRRTVMCYWADYLTGRHAAGQVIPMHRGTR